MWRLGCGAIGLTAGFVTSRVLPNVPFFAIQRDIDIVAATALGITIVLGTAVQRHIERAKYSDVLRKQTLLQRLGRCGEKVDVSDRETIGVAADEEEYLIDVILGYWADAQVALERERER